MTKIPSVEERVEEFIKTLKGEFPCQMFGGVPHYDILLLKEELKASFTAEREAGAREERERIKKEITEQTLFNNDDDTFVKLSEALWVCDSKEDRDRFIQALTPPTK